MNNLKVKRKSKEKTTPAQSKLFKESLKSLLGLGLIESKSHPIKVERVNFLKDALNPKLLS